MVGSQPVPERVVESVATATSTDPVELPRLYDVIDPDALETAVRTMTGGEICFHYAEHAVTVRSDGTVHVTDEATSQPTRATAATDD